MNKNLTWKLVLIIVLVVVAVSSLVTRSAGIVEGASLPSVCANIHTLFICIFPS